MKNNLTFDQWIQKINKLLILEIGLTTDDLPDMCYMDFYESGTSPEEMIEEIKEENDYFGE
jgi:hypothetical protein